MDKKVLIENEGRMRRHKINNLKLLKAKLVTVVKQTKNVYYDSQNGMVFGSKISILIDFLKMTTKQKVNRKSWVEINNVFKLSPVR